jgi:hypothetical protein
MVAGRGWAYRETKGLCVVILESLGGLKWVTGLG